MRTVAACWFAVFFSAGSVRAERVELVAGGAKSVAAIAAVDSKLDGPFGVDFDSAGNAYLVEISGHRVLKIDARGVMTKLGGTGEKGDGGDGGPPLQARFNGMHSLVIAPNDDLYIADTWNNRVRKIAASAPRTSATGGDRKYTITNVAGTGEKGFSGDDASASAAQCGGIYCIALNKSGDRLYLADLDNRRIRMVDLKSGVITTVAGNGDKGVPEDGAEAKSSPLVDPRAVAVDSKGNVYILERNGHALRVVDGEGKIHTVAGTGKAGFSGDGGDALKAELRGPKHLCVDRDDSVLIADAENHVVRRYTPKDGKITRVAGTGEVGTGGVGGPPDKLQMKRPHGVAVDKQGTIYIVDSGNNRLLRIVP